MTVVTLTDLTPVPRVDTNPWVVAALQESVDSDPGGTWATIQTYALDPVDTDPANPNTRSFTSEAGTLAQGWYRIVWSDDDGDTSTTPAVQNLHVVRAYRPQVSDVGELLRGRTVDTNGVEQGTFTPQTRPTFEQADRVIDRAMEKLEAKFGPTMKTELVGAAATVVALRAAMMIELSFFGEQIAPGRSPYLQLRDLYNEALADWDAWRLRLGTDDTPDSADDGPMPAYRFPSLRRDRCQVGLGGPDDFHDEDWPGRFGL